MEKIKTLEAKKDELKEQLRQRGGTKLSIVEFVKLNKEITAIQVQLDKLYQELD